MGDEDSQVDSDSSCEQGVVDLLPQLKEPRMSMAHASPDGSWMSTRREGPHILQGQDKWLNLKRLETPGNRFLIVGVRFAEKPKGEMKLFGGCPADPSHRFLEICQQCPVGIWQIDRDEETFGRLAMHPPRNCRRRRPGARRTLPQPHPGFPIVPLILPRIIHPIRFLNL